MFLLCNILVLIFMCCEFWKFCLFYCREGFFVYIFLVLWICGSFVYIERVGICCFGDFVLFRDGEYFGWFGFCMFLKCCCVVLNCICGFWGGCRCRFNYVLLLFFFVWVCNGFVVDVCNYVIFFFLLCDVVLGIGNVYI